MEKTCFFPDRSLYLVLSKEYGRGRSVLHIAEQAIAGGVNILQMREKDQSPQELLLLGKELSRLCRERSVIFIVNDDPLLARELDADGVHMGQEDLWSAPRIRCETSSARGRSSVSPPIR
ncbi:MAG: thiamine phosphate synthase [Syntrophales bacterium]|nr:thiamine phosphate synthase [Syntrophales bacterium]